MLETDGELLTELRAYGGWYTHYPDLDRLAERAAAAGSLHLAVDAAHYRMGAGWSGSSKSSGLDLVAGPDGFVEDNQAFLLALRGEIARALVDR